MTDRANDLQTSASVMHRQVTSDEYNKNRGSLAPLQRSCLVQKDLIKSPFNKPRMN